MAFGGCVRKMCWPDGYQESKWPLTISRPNLMTASGPECVKTPEQTLAMISEKFIARETHETVYPR